MPVWAQWALGIAAVLTAASTIWRLFLKPMASLISLQEAALPLLRDIVRVFGNNPNVFDVLSEIAKEFRTDSGSSLRDVVNRLEHAATANTAASQVLRVEVEASRQLAVQDREQLQRLILSLDRITVKIDAGDVVRDRMEAATGVVASDLAEAHQRADAIGPGHETGAASDAAARTDPNKETP